MASPRPTAKPAQPVLPKHTAGSRLWIYNRPDASPPAPTAFAELGKVEIALPPETAALGLLLLTNDHEVSRLLSLPAAGWVRRYLIEVEGKIAPALIAQWAAGTTIDNLPYGPVEVRAAEKVGRRQWYAVTLREGRGRTLAVLIAASQVPARRLCLTSLGPFQLGALAPGAIEELPPDVWQAQLGGKFKRAK